MPLRHKQEVRKFREMYLGKMVDSRSWVNRCNDKRAINQKPKWEDVTCPDCLTLRR